MFSSSDTQTDQSGAPALQRGGGDAQGPPAPQHRALLRLLEVHGEGTQVCPAGHRAHDLRHTQNVSSNLIDHKEHLSYPSCRYTPV